MTAPQQNMRDFLAKAGFKKLNKSWAKMEILFGLLAVAAGLLASQWAVLKTNEPEWIWLASGVLLFVLGGYLALAGHRSHLYQSNNQLTVLLLQELHRSQSQG